jgi:glycosyltransferase involved in cell wall biosynthesis
LVRNLAKYYPDNTYHLFSPTLPTQMSEFQNAPFRAHTAGHPFSAWWRSYGMAQDISKLKPAIFHGLSHELPYSLAGRGVPQVVTMHDLIFMRFPQDFPWFDRQVYAAKWRHSLKSADKIIAISESTAADLIDLYNVPAEKIETIYQSCDERYYAPPPMQTEVRAFQAQHKLPNEYLLSVGSITERKNLLTVIRALDEIPKDQRPLLVIVGEGKSYKNRVLAEIAALKLEPNIRFWEQGQASVAELRLLYAGATASVFMSVYEGFGLPVAESLLCGTPVVTSNVSSLPEAAGPGALLVNPLEVLEVRDAMQSVITDPGTKRRLAEKGNQFARERFDSERVTRQLMEVYAGFRR